MERDTEKSIIPKVRRPVWRSALLAGSLLVGAGLGATPALAGSPEGFLYGIITTDRGTTYEGRIRWDEEEAFWGDHFNSSKESRVALEDYMDDMPKDMRKEESRAIKVFGVKIGVSFDKYHSSGRQLTARFGDIDRIEVDGRDQAILVMKSGAKVEVDGGSNDLGTTIYVWDSGVGKIGLEWRDIETIDFRPAPKDLEVDVYRLHGLVETDIGDFEGYIQWDQDECLSTDKLDGESEDGSLSIPMGNIRRIERRSRGSSRVVLKDGREFVLDDSNDVDDDNRGIFVEDERFGRVLVSWDAFEAIELSGPGDSGPTYDDFADGGALRGTVTDRDGKTHRGRIFYDLDENQAWEMLDGDYRDVSYSIPMGMIAAIVPLDEQGSRIILKNGEEVELEDSADVDEDNDGVLVVAAESARGPIYVPWKEVARVEFDD